MEQGSNTWNIQDPARLLRSDKRGDGERKISSRIRCNATSVGWDSKSIQEKTKRKLNRSKQGPTFAEISSSLTRLLIVPVGNRSTGDGLIALFSSLPDGDP